MISGYVQQSIVKEVEPIITGMGFALVELKFGRSKNQNHVSITVYRSEGVGIDDCAAISKNLLPRLELIEWLDNLRFEVSSPGVERVIKRREEYKIFIGIGVRILLSGEKDWIKGIIDNVSKEKLFLNQKGRIMEIRFDDIQKARLDYTQEVSG